MTTTQMKPNSLAWMIAREVLDIPQGRSIDSLVNCLRFDKEAIARELSVMLNLGFCELYLHGWRLTAPGREAFEAAGGTPEFFSAEDIPGDPAIATCCLDEDEIDAWWHGLDVGEKADAFLEYALTTRHKTSRQYIEPHPEPHQHVIPVEGTIGEQVLRSETGLGDWPTTKNLWCPACGEEGGDWRRLNPVLRKGGALNLAKNERTAASNDGSGLYVYAHACRSGAQGDGSGEVH